MTELKTQTDEAIDLLKSLIATPSFSREESKTADLIQDFLQDQGVPTKRHLHNVWTLNNYFDSSKPTLLLNSHHDTVKPNDGYTRDPFEASEEDGKLYGLGSNDAGGPLVTLMATFLHFYEREDLNWNLVFCASAEEEVSGENGLGAVLSELPKLDCALVGEPTQMRMGVAEKGLMVLDCEAQGVSGHAARDEGENAIYKAMKDIEWLRTYEFDNKSEYLGPIRMSVTQIEAGTQHNVVPDRCSFVVDIRSTDAYTHDEILEIIKAHITSEATPRSTRLKPSSIPLDHPLVKAGKNLGLCSFGSPTLSDQAVLSIPSMKMGPGQSARSHTSDEYIELKEIEEGIDTYIKLLTEILTA